MPAKKSSVKRPAKKVLLSSKIKTMPSRIKQRSVIVAKSHIANLKTRRAESLHKTGKLSRRSELPQFEKLPAWWKLQWRALLATCINWRQFVPVIIIFATLVWLTSGVYTLSSLTSLKELFVSPENFFDGLDQTLIMVSTLANTFFASSSTSGDSGSDILKAILFCLAWLVVLWLTRHFVAKKHTTIREALYKSGSALTPTILVIFIIIVQLIPLALAMLFSSSVFGNGFLEGPAEKSIFGVVALLLAVLSVYLLSGSFMALPIVSLPGMYPIKALVNAKRLVSGRRARVVMKLLGFVVGAIMLWLLLFVPVMLLDNFVLCPDGASCWSTITVVPFMFYAITSFVLCAFTISFYFLYRSLLEKSEKNI